MPSFNTVKNITHKHPVFLLFILHTLFVAIIVLFLRVFIHLPDDFFLSDDGYYALGKNFFYGYASLWHQIRGPGIPIILSSLNFFPDYLHPYLRILITQLFTLINIYLAFKIFSRFLPKNVIFWGLIISLFNPLYLWWTCIRSSPEIYATAFLGLIILASFGLLKNKKMLSLIALIILIPLSLLFKPVLFLIPFFLFIHFLSIKDYKLVRGTFLLFLIGFLSLVGTMKLTKPANEPSYGEVSIMFDAFFTESLLQTGQLGYNRGSGELPEEGSSTEYIYIKIKEWTDNYEKKHGELDPIDMNIAFIQEKMDVILISKLLNPVYFISFADTTRKTIAIFAINTAILFFSLRNLKKVKNNFKAEISVLIFIFIGFYSIYFLTTSIARYAIPLLFYISVFSGMSVVNLIKKFSIKQKPPVN